jgi:3-oxoacyl-(acyl-carrier-protein) synthase
MMIASGNLRQAVVGGVDTVFSPAVFHNWCALYAMTRQNA